MLEPHYFKDKVEAGCDEAGRGCLAGSVYAAAVILPEGYDNPELNDSKKLTPQRRYALRESIERDAVAWAIGVVTPEEIDKINILHASFLAMHRAVAALAVSPEALVIDGNRFDAYNPSVPEQLFKTRPHKLGNGISECTGDGNGCLPFACVVKGDGRYQTIAAASILAKTFRDDYMDGLAKEYPYYDWQDNKGYPTRRHREGIRLHGITPYHRRSYNLLGSGELPLPFSDND